MFWYSPCCLKVRWQMQILERWPGSIFSSSSLVQRTVKLLEPVRSLPPLFLSLCLGAWLWESPQYINSQYNFVWADPLVLQVVLHIACFKHVSSNYAHWAAFVLAGMSYRCCQCVVNLIFPQSHSVTAKI